MKTILAGVIIVVLAVSALAAVVVLADGQHPASGGGDLTLTKEQSGLVASDPLDGYQTQQQLQANGSYWSYGGTTNSSSYYSFYESADELNIGIVAPDSGEWSGFYAVTPPTNAYLVHANLTATTSQVSGYYDTGLYMQSTNQLVNYLTCLAITTPSGTMWGVVHGYGTTLTNVVITPLWVDTSPNQPDTRDCTLVTNGQSYIRVYMDNQEVYSSNSTDLGMPAPYNFFVEEESEFAGHILYGQYQDFYATANDSVTINDIPSTAAGAAIVGQNGQVYASTAVSGGTATMYVGKYDFPMSAYVRVYSSATTFTNATQLASTSLEQVYGGDVYTFGSVSHRTYSLSVGAQDTSGHTLNGFYVTVSQGRTIIANGSTPWTFTDLNGSEAYTVTAYNYGSYVFDHWSDGSTSSEITVSPDQVSSLTAIYRSTSSPPPAGETSVTIDGVDSSGNPVTGMSVTVWRDGVLVGLSYTPANFDLATGSTYLVAAAGYGQYTFSGWSNGTTSAYYQFVPQGQSMTLTAVYTG